MANDQTDRVVDVLIVGAGNAAFCAAHAARDRGASVLMVEKTPAAETGGNSFYTAGAFRVTHDGVHGLRPYLNETTVARLDTTELSAYPAETFIADMRRLTEGHNDDAMTDRLVSDSADLVAWLAEHGITWRLMYERQSYQRDGRDVFFGGLAVGTVDGGKGLIAQHTAHALGSGVEIRYGTAVTGLLRDDTGRVTGVLCTDAEGNRHQIRAGTVVLAAGGFEADPQRRKDHLGEGWERALVRGSPANTGEVLDAALAVGADRFGDWASCHSVQWDANASPSGGNRELTNQLTRQSYPIGIVVNNRGNRFIDEGADYRNYTYAKYGREILRQPEGIAFQLFDATTRPLLRTEEYDSSPITMAEADTLEDLAAKLGIDPDGLVRTVREFNGSIEDRPFEPAVKDNRVAKVDPPKSNWAMALATPPFYGYAVSCGITFTFGGLRVAVDNAQVLDTEGERIPGLYAAGELVGGLFSGNYPGGTGLTAGAVFGRAAGAAAAAESAAN
ncbi:tricarballylate dehydrogenase [Tamaricihabitans halophyticus]|uniref:Tricarballylate dehydrogenase n=1 Tax=Tamaricihabitans halophyticus TaxID=1262583 RepID=A0A4R2QM62_9PSEU|nr:FAD-dependent tricarballylate dehydrogenase TcuA [Tamaricihabitans halophyticus]TCP49924.1 tricarballylate dehydrogenase [Tamaricihabitans halophyticus]